MTLTTDEIIEMIERDFPGWEWLLRSNFDAETDVTRSTARYFANVMTPDYEGVFIETKLGVIDVSPGQRFTAYAETRHEALAIAYQKAMTWLSQQEPHQ